MPKPTTLCPLVELWQWDMYDVLRVLCGTYENELYSVTVPWEVGICLMLAVTEG